jgi:hypothetical protein
MGPVGADEVARDLAAELVIGRVTAPARDQAKVFPAASELMLGQVLIPRLADGVFRCGSDRKINTYKVSPKVASRK